MTIHGRAAKYAASRKAIMTEKRDRVKPEGFEYLSCCGHGSYGEAWLVREIGFGPKRILKLINKDTESQWETEKSGLLTYYEHLEEMNPEESRFFVNVLHHGENDDYFWYTMQAADNLLGKKSDGYLPCTLANLMKQRRLTPVEIAEISLSILEGLKILRKHNIVHRDIKPDNIFFFNGKPSLGDIGLMQSLDEDERIMAEIGCKEFIPPEARADGDLMQITGAEWDLYAFGKLLYCMDTGNNVTCFPLANMTVPSTDAKVTDLWTRIAAEQKNARLTNIDEIAEEFKSIRAKYDPKRLSRPQIAMLSAVVIFFVVFAFALINVLTSTSYDNIFEAIADNNLPGVIRRIKNGDKIDSMNEDREYPITLALKNPNIDIGIIQELYENGAYRTGQEMTSHIEQAISNRLPSRAINFLIGNSNRTSEIRDSEGGDLLHTAIRMHDMDSFTRLLPGMDVNTTDKNGHSTLMHAMHTNQLSIAHNLIDNGADVTYRDKKGFSILHVCKWNPDDAALYESIIKKSDVNLRNAFGETPLLCAVRRRVSKVFITLLISNGADVNIPDSEGITPLAEAIALDSGDTFELLVAKGAKTDVKDTNGFSPLHIAAIYGRSFLMRRLLELGADANARDLSGRTPLHRAVMLDGREIVKTLVEAKADTTAKDSLGLTPSDLLYIFDCNDLADLIPAVSAPSEALSKYRNLISRFSIKHKPISKESRDKLVELLSSTSSPLDSKNIRLIRDFNLLLIGEPDINPNQGEKDLLRLAIDNQNTNILIKLLACAPDINLADESGITPALATALYNKTDALLELCKYGANISAKANDGRDIFSIAYHAKSLDILALMRISMHETMLDMPLPVQTRQILDTIATSNQFQSVKEYKNDNNIFTEDDFILATIRKQNASAVARSLSMGISTPNLEIAIGRYVITDENLYYQMLAMLLSCGAQPNIHSITGTNALCKAIYDSRQFYYIRLLLDYGANPTIKDSRGIDAFKAASEFNNISLEQLLEFYHPIPTTTKATK